MTGPPLAAEPAVERRGSRASKAKRISLDLLSIAPVYDPVMVALRREQVRHVCGATLRSQIFALITVVMMAWELRDEVAATSLAMWIAAAGAVALGRLFQARTVGRNLVETLPPRVMRDLTLLVVLSALLWVVPAFLWSPMLNFH